ncbi:hypothetical protein FHR83_007201 [Actinoplanes campanulatus]|uniref:AttH domain-containing protein n=1 Tax=Actinoplanes campanulatus TaxID=113559 RepID=A0A7W5APC3_9ACTN|nr:lipocalin-like domain-containing protein [Actinoplanes campanulatus]MBB3099494.1 hypothetical protein [Actinoplanes campanulatus]
MNHTARTSRRTLLQGATAGLLVPATATVLGRDPVRAAPGTPPPNGYTANWVGNRPADFARVGLSPSYHQQWEDGFRTAAVNADPDAYEWWYSDFTGDDGTVVSFTLKTRPTDGFEPDATEADRAPGVSLIITEPDGTNHRVVKNYTWDDFTSSTDRCDVRVGPFTFKGDLKTYRMRGADGDLAIDLTLTSLVSPFRPGTGFRFLNDTDRYQAWFAAVPAGEASGTITVAGKRRRFAGRGYHDHNWGNVPFAEFVDHWRWGRGSIDQYAVIGVDFRLRPEYDSSSQPILLVDDTRTGKRLIASFDPRAITATELDPRPHPDPAYPKDYYATVDWRYANGTDHARVTMTDTENLIVARQYLTDPSAAQQATMTRLGIDQVWYTRYDTTIGFELDAAGLTATGNGEGTLENAQFGMGSSPPKSTP